jgi:hypothetical protein
MTLLDTRLDPSGFVKDAVIHRRDFHRTASEMRPQVRLR